tara:strand:- start:650 stop:916 length:267 start_codon:yes stop_codon:yes gene_type:complete
MKITKRQLRQIINEEKAKILNEQQMIPDAEVMEMLKEGLVMIGLNRIVNEGDNILESEVVQFVMDTSTMDQDRVYEAIEKLAMQNNLM